MGVLPLVTEQDLQGFTVNEHEYWFSRKRLRIRIARASVHGGVREKMLLSTCMHDKIGGYVRTPSTLSMGNAYGHLALVGQSPTSTRKSGRLGDHIIPGFVPIGHLNAAI